MLERFLLLLEISAAETSHCLRLIRFPDPLVNWAREPDHFETNFTFLEAIDLHHQLSHLQFSVCHPCELYLHHLLQFLNSTALVWEYKVLPPWFLNVQFVCSIFPFALQHFVLVKLHPSISDVQGSWPIFYDQWLPCRLKILSNLNFFVGWLVSMFCNIWIGTG